MLKNTNEINLVENTNIASSYDHIWILCLTCTVHAYHHLSDEHNYKTWGSIKQCPSYYYNNVSLFNDELKLKLDSISHK